MTDFVLAQKQLMYLMTHMSMFLENVLQLIIIHGFVTYILIHLLRLIYEIV
jgi:hypothetical protein